MIDNRTSPVGRLARIRVGPGSDYIGPGRMADFIKINSDRERVRVRHCADGHEYEFGFLRPDGTEWHEPHLVFHSEGDGATGTGLAGLYLEEARTWAAAIHAGEPLR